MQLKLAGGGESSSLAAKEKACLESSNAWCVRCKRHPSKILLREHLLDKALHLDGGSVQCVADRPRLNTPAISYELSMLIGRRGHKRLRDDRCRHRAVGDTSVRRFIGALSHRFDLLREALETARHRHHVRILEREGCRLARVRRHGPFATDVFGAGSALPARSAVTDDCKWHVSECATITCKNSGILTVPSLQHFLHGRWSH